MLFTAFVARLSFQKQLANFSFFGFLMAVRENIVSMKDNNAQEALNYTKKNYAFKINWSWTDCFAQVQQHVILSFVLLGSSVIFR